MAGAIAHTAGLLAAIEGLNIKCPHEVKHSVVLFDRRRFSKASLIVVLIQLEVFQVLQIGPAILLEQATLRKAQDTCRRVPDVAREFNVIAAYTLESRVIAEEFNMVVQLVMHVLGEVLFRHDGNTSVGNVGGDFGVRENKHTIQDVVTRERGKSSLGLCDCGDGCNSNQD